jgi:hypothetical protein
LSSSLEICPSRPFAKTILASGEKSSLSGSIVHIIELLILGVCKVKPVLILALNPMAFLCKTMLIIPDIPSGLYLALDW